MRKRIALVVGARPNFMKAAPLIKKLRESEENFDSFLIHTGQHYDRQLSELFFEQLQMPQPDIYLGVGSCSHAEQTAKIMIELEKSFQELKIDLVVVFGDVNSTMAAAIVAAKLGIKVAHVEAGLRSFDHTMPEEINRIVTDRLSDYLFVTEPSGMRNLINEGVSERKIFFTGNIMIDSLLNNLEKSESSPILNKLAIQPKKFATITLHRPANVDNCETLKGLLNVIRSVGKKLPIVFPCHPRTKRRIEEFGLLPEVPNGNVRVIEPLGYLDFLKLQSNSKIVLTDSGGVQEETTFLKIPCLTIRENTERPVTVDVGTNVLCGSDPNRIVDVASAILDGHEKKSEVPELWDGAASGRIAGILKAVLTN
ncbi:MAG: non-hydrolyzing UDP-N-acetylglucosamine 2-epimerase [Candidatus Zixiibacteriota bacterium]